MFEHFLVRRRIPPGALAVSLGFALGAALAPCVLEAQALTVVSTSVSPDGREAQVATNVGVGAPAHHPSRVLVRFRNAAQTDFLPGSQPAGADRTERLPTLERLQRTEPRPIQRAGNLPGLVYRGQLVTYAIDTRGVRYAVLDTGRELTAIPAPRGSIAVGRNVRATGRELRDENRNQRRLAWRFGYDERAQARQRERG